MIQISRKVASTQGKTETPLAYVRCRAMRKHDLDGHLFEERSNGRKVWVARLECTLCGTHRIDVMTPHGCELISREYVRPEDYDTQMTADEARKLIYAHMMNVGARLSTLGADK